MSVKDENVAIHPAHAPTDTYMSTCSLDIERRSGEVGDKGENQDEDERLIAT